MSPTRFWKSKRRDDKEENGGERVARLARGRMSINHGWLRLECRRTRGEERICGERSKNEGRDGKRASPRR